LKSSRFFLADVKPLLALLLFCMNSNINMQRLAMLNDYTLCFRFNYFVSLQAQTMLSYTGTIFLMYHPNQQTQQ
jgi:hypothetical protein